jgi:hypothetical protein
MELGGHPPHRRQFSPCNTQDLMNQHIAIVQQGRRHPVRAVLVLVLLSAIDRLMRRSESLEAPELRFDDLPEPAVATLGLSWE